MPPHPAPRAGLSASATGLFLLLVLADTSCVSSMHEYQGHTVFNPLYTPYLESSARDRWQLPEEVLEALGVAPGQTIADIGAGGGYFTERFSRKVGPAGRVFATDVQKTMVRKLERRVEKRDLANVTVIRGAFDDPRLPPASCDLVFFSSVYKEIDERPRYLQHVMKTLKPGGRVAILEYRPQTREPGPPREHRLSEETVLAEMGAAGFELVERHDFLPREYFLVFGLARREGSPGADSSVCVRVASAPHSPSGPMTQRSPRPPALPWQRRVVPLAPSDGERVRVRGDFVHPSPGSLHGYITLQVPLQVGPVELAAGTRLFR